MKTQRPLLGASLALLTSMTWGSLPLAIQQVLKIMDASTLVWIRFLVAGVAVFCLLAVRGKLPHLSQFNRKLCLLLGLGVIGLSGNFTLFAKSLNYISPTTTQVLWQLAPFGMMFASILLFGEKMGKFQKIGSGLLFIGLVAFFNDHFAELFQIGRYAIGIALGSGAALIWVFYGVAQKTLLKTFTSPQILMMIYLGCGVALTTIATPSQLGNLSGATIGFFLYCCVNTLIGYGAFGEALNHWDASKVSVMTTMLPIFTMIFSLLGHHFYPNTFAVLEMNFVSYVGALIVVCGAILAVAGDKLFALK